MSASRALWLVAAVLIVRLGILIMPALVMGVLLSLIVSTVGVRVLPAAIIRPARASMLGLNRAEGDERAKCKDRDPNELHCHAPFMYLETDLRRLFTNSALPAFLRTMPAVVTVLAGVARVGTSAGSRKQVELDLVHQDERQHDVS